MAQETVGIKIQIDGGQATQSVGSLKQQLREAQKEVTELSAKFGATSQQAVEAAKKAAELKDAIGDAKSLTDAFNPDAKFRAFTSTLAGVAGGFAAVQGALGLVGVESDKVEKTLLKVQSAMAISQGLQTIGESIDSFKQLGAVIRNVNIFQKAYNAATIAAAAIQRAFGVAVSTTGVAFKALRAAIITTGIGALVVGIGLLINKIVEWNESSKAAADAQKALAKEIENQNDVIDVQISKLEALGGKEDEIYQKRVERIQNELRLTTEKLKRGEELNDEEIKQRIKLASQLEVLDIQEQKRKDKSAEEQAKKAEEARKKAADEALKKQQEDAALEDAIEARRIERLKERIDAADKILDILDKKDEERKKIQAEKEKERVEKEKDLLNQRIQNNLEALQFQIQSTQNANAEIIRNEEEAAQRRIDIQNGFIDLSSNLAGLLRNVAGQNKALQIAAIVAEQAGSIARIVSNTAVANAKAVAATPLTAGQPFVGINTASAAISIASSIAAATKGIQQIKSSSQSVGGASTLPRGSAGAPISPEPPLVNTRTQLDATSIQQLGSATNRAYVIESDVTNNQERIRRINRAARLG
jgi:DNA repair exonuclease SbcCD ATPase subunit